MNDDLKAKVIIAVTGITAVSILQIVAWMSGHNGQVFALTSSIIGVSVGFFLGFTKKVKDSIKQYGDEKLKNW